jgi:arginyl-tRNA--protein-N-Asp/Glu arginylyltransferase
MKIFRAEFNNNYLTYTFGYAEYALMESVSDLHLLYQNGFLPFSANIKLNYPVFYMARSLRVNSALFSDSSENRRVNRKVSEFEPEIERIALSKEFTKDEKFLNFCLSYAEERFTNNAMNRERLQYIFGCGIATDIFRFTKKNDSEPFAYVLSAIDGNSLHFWFSFFDTSYLKDIPVGKWLMWRMIKWAQENSISYIYLGTTYGEKSLYKIRDFNGLEFFDGTFWNDDIGLLKEKCKTDSIMPEADSFKLFPNANQFIEKLKTS